MKTYIYILSMVVFLFSSTNSNALGVFCQEEDYRVTRYYNCGYLDVCYLYDKEAYDQCIATEWKVWGAVAIVATLGLVAVAVSNANQAHNTYGFTPTYNPVNNEVGVRYSFKW